MKILDLWLIRKWLRVAAQKRHWKTVAENRWEALRASPTNHELLEVYNKLRAAEEEIYELKERAGKLQNELVAERERSRVHTEDSDAT